MAYYDCDLDSKVMDQNVVPINFTKNMVLSSKVIDQKVIPIFDTKPHSIVTTP